MTEKPTSLSISEDITMIDGECAGDISQTEEQLSLVLLDTVTQGKN